MITVITEKIFSSPGFEESHLKTGENEYLIMGNIPVTEPDKDIPQELTDLLGRWEGFGYGPFQTGNDYSGSN